MAKPDAPFTPLSIAVLTVSDTRTIDTDTSGQLLADSLSEAGHQLADRQLQLDKMVDGFGELFRHISWQEIGTSTLQSRALAGLANRTLIVCVPGSTNACRTAWTKILQEQLDSRTRPCNFVQHLGSVEQCGNRA